MHDSSQTHREIVAAVASLKSCLRSVIIAVSSPAVNTATPPDSKIQGSVQRANDAVGKLEGLLSAVADQTLRLPLETSKRLVDVGLPDLLQQLLNACQLAAAWPAPAQAASAASTSSTDGSVAVPPSEADMEAAAAAPDTAATAPAALHPSWASVQQLLQAVFSTLAVLTSVLIRACTRSHDPAMVLMQLASPDVMAAQVTYLQQLRQHAAQLQSSAGSETADPLAAQSIECAPACVAAFTAIYGLLAAATDAQTGLEELRLQLISSLCSTQLLPVAAELLLLVPVTMQPEQQQEHQVQVDCQAAGWSLLTLALFTSGAGISICPADMNPASIRPGQPVPSSLMAASIRADTADQPQPRPIDLVAAFSAAAEPSAATLQQQLLSQPVLSLLQERLYHCVTELRGSYGASSTALAQQQKLLAQAGAPSQLLLLPGRCCPADQDVLHAVLRALRAWRALLTGPAAPSLPLSTNFGVHLVLTLLAGVLAEPIRAGSSEREALRGRVIRVAVHCLQLMCSCLSHELLTQQLPALTAALAGVVGTAGAYWDSNRRAVKSEALPYTGQVRCVDKVTGDMMVRYTMAAQSALELMKQLLATCRAYAGTPLGDSHAGGVRVAQVMLSAGVLPALEQLFRQLPVVSPAHVTAMLFLVELLPLCMTAELSSGQLPLLVTLRKFTVKSVGIPEPDREASMITATQLAALLGTMASVYASSHTTPGGPADTLMQHAAVQLLPALQAYVSAVLKTPIPAPHSTTVSTCSVAATAAALSSSGAAAEPARAHLLPAVLHMYQQLAALGSTAPQLQLGPALLCAQALPTVTDILSSNYWLLPGFQAAAGLATGRLSPTGAQGTSRSSSVSEGGSSGSMFTGEYAVRTALLMLDSLVACQAAGSALTLQIGSAGGSGMHGSCSSDCLCAMKRTEGSDTCQIGNAKCGMHGWCCCGSPKASSDIMAPVTRAVTQAPGAVLPGQQQLLLLVLSRLMQTRLLPELLRVVTQLPGPAAVDIPASKGTSPKPIGNAVVSFNRPGSANGLTVNVPARRTSLHRDHKGGVSPGGVSPKVYSPLGHSAPSGVMLTSSLHSQTCTATQSFLTAYMGEMPSTALGSNSSSSSAAHPVANGFRVTAASTSRFASSGSAAAGTSPRHVDDGAYGLLRAGSSGSNFDWGAGVTSSALLQEAGVKVAVRDSSAYGSSPSLASLASPHALSAGADSMSPFVMSQREAAGAAAAAGGAPAAAADSAGSHLQVKLEALLLAVAQHTLALADAGLLGPELLQRRPSGISAGGDSDSGTAGATPVEGSTPSGLPKPALFGSASGSVSWLSASGAGGVSRQLSSVASGPGSLYSSYLQSSGGPRGSLSGSGHFGAVTAEDVLAGIRSSLAAAGASAVVRPDAAAPSDAGAFAAGAKDLVTVGGSPIGAQHEAIPVGQVVLGEGGPSRQGSSPGPGSGGSPGGHSASLAFEASNSDIMFPVDLGLSQLAISTRAGPAEVAGMGAQAPAAAAAAPAAPPGTPATPANWPVSGSGAGSAAAAAAAAAPPQQLGLSIDLLRRLQGSLSAAGPLLARHSGVMEPEVLCPQVMLARLAPQPVGCWNPACTNMPGVSEATVPSKPCNSCKVASFCSKACEKMAWSEHTMACSRLAALAAAAAAAAEVAV